MSLNLNPTLRYKIQGEDKSEWIANASTSAIISESGSGNDFSVEPGICGDGTSITIRLVDDGRVVSHQAFQVGVQQEKDLTEKSNACWLLMSPGLCGRTGTVSFQAMHHPGHYLSIHDNGEVWAEEILDTEEARLKTCFALISGEPIQAVEKKPIPTEELAPAPAPPKEEEKPTTPEAPVETKTNTEEKGLALRTRGAVKLLFSGQYEEFGKLSTEDQVFVIGFLALGSVVFILVLRKLLRG
jgi:hypothetical protein